jgi:hypothetical protein
MQQIDPRLSERVWNRVMGTAPPAPEPLLELIHLEWTDVSAALYLALRHKGQEAALLRTIARQDQSHAKSLTGLYYLLTGQKPTVTTPPPKAEPTDAALRHIIAEKLRRAQNYSIHTADPDYGFLFRLREEQELQHIGMLLEILGTQHSRS